MESRKSVYNSCLGPAGRSGYYTAGKGNVQRVKRVIIHAQINPSILGSTQKHDAQSFLYLQIHNDCFHALTVNEIALVKLVLI